MFDHLSTHVLLTLFGIVVALVTSNAILWIATRKNPTRDLTEVSLRLKTWWMIVGLFSLVLLISQTASIVFMAFVSFLALKEFLSLIPTRRADHRVLFWAYLAIPIQYYWIYSHWFGLFIIFIPVYMFMWLPTRMVSIGETDGFLRAVGTLHWGLMTTVFSLSHAAYLLVLTPGETSLVKPQWSSEAAAACSGVSLLLLLVLLTQFNDIAQFCWGKMLGSRKVAPKVSPGKTWGGLLGGVASTVALASVLGPWLTCMDLTRSAIAGLIIGISGFFADLSISALKRDLGVKDSGFSLPGHGGILDRVDSLTFTAPLFFHFVYYCYGEVVAR
ncbi:phosphatidate cytidylyltransferase [Planctomycetes bacterium K23_9]|uniref:Phosphatidate cytidylyltransferase n=1 Tax=Stieleria marina TaxID=1930275 RepID=A0A517NP73_9BACT|nr:Phosphatidate cytidylyltransferase [Planctomycetes bacterium K23_9]